MKLSRAWHLLINDDGTRAAHGGRPLTVGIDHDGRLWLIGDPIDGGGLLLADDSAEWLSRTLTDARIAAGDRRGRGAPFAVVPRLRRLGANEDPEPDAQGGMSHFGSLPVVADDDDDPPTGRFLP